MRILQVNKFFFNRGGAESVFFNLSNLLQRNGHTVVPFSCNYPDTLDSPYRKYFIPPIETQKVRFGGAGARTALRFLWSREAARALDRLLTDHPVDIAHLHNIYHQISPSILPVLRRHHVPVVMTLHDFHLVSPAYGLIDAHGRDASYLKGGHWFRAVAKRSVKDSYAASMLCASELFLHRSFKVYEKGVHTFIAPSKFLADTIQEWGFHPPKLTVLPNFVDDSAFSQYTAPTKAVLYAGRLSPEKGVGLLLDIIAKLPHVRFIIAGSGPMDDAVRAAAARHAHVQWIGRVPADRMPEIYAQAGIVIVPTTGVEVMPLAILEAFAAGRPVAAAAVGGIPEMVAQGTTGMLVPKGDCDGFVRAIEDLLADDAELLRMGRAAREAAAARYSADAHYQRLMEIYKKVINEYARLNFYMPKIH